MSADSEAIGFRKHNHSGCINATLDVAEARCARRSLRLTAIRRRVLEILLKEHKAMGAYEILEQLHSDGHRSQPPVAYRALDFLVRLGVVHKIERLNAFVACSQPDSSHTPLFMICRACEHVAEISTNASRNTLANAARDSGFQLERSVIEAEGLCPSCQRSAA